MPEKKFFFPLFLFLIFEVIFYIYYGGVNHVDECYYLFYSSLFKDGISIYKDYFYHQPPFLPIFYGIIFKIFPISLLTGRIISSLLFIISIFFMFKIMKILKIQEKNLLLILIALNTPFIFFSSTFYPFSLVNLLQILAIYSYFRFNHVLLKTFLTATFFSFSALTRINSLPLFFVFLILIFITKKQKIKEIFYLLIFFLLWHIVFLLPYFINAGFKTIFKAYLWNFWGIKLVFRKRFPSLISTLKRDYYAVKIIITCLLPLLVPFFTSIFNHNLRKILLKNFHFLLFLLLILSYLIPQFIFHPLSHWFTFYYYPLGVLLIVLIFKVIKEYPFYNILKNTTIITAVFSFIVIGAFADPYNKFIDTDTSSYLRNPDIKILSQLQQKTLQYTKKGEKVLIFDFAPIVSTGRFTFPEFAMPLYNFAPYRSTEFCKNFGFLNGEILINYAKKRIPNSVIIYKPNFFQEAKIYKKGPVIWQDFEFYLKNNYIKVDSFLWDERTYFFYIKKD